MKPFITALAMCVLLIGVSGAFAADRTWTGATSADWDDGTNWGVAAANCPGGNTGTFNRSYDRADFGDGDPQDTILFDDGSGADECDCRTIVEFFMEPDAANNLILNAAGDELYVTQFIMRSTANASVELLINDGAGNNQEGGKVYVSSLLETTAVSDNTSTITVNDEDALLKVGRLVMTASGTAGGAAPLDIDAGKVIVTELVATADANDVTISVDGSTAVMDVERMVLTNSASNKAQLTVSTATTAAKVYVGELIMDGSSATAAGGKATLTVGGVDKTAELHMGTLDVKGHATHHASLTFYADSTVSGKFHVVGDTDMNIVDNYSVACGRCVIGASTELHMTGAGTLSCG